MENKLEPGDLAFVIKSVSNKSVGKIVECISMDGIHSKYGPIWKCKSNGPIVTVGGDSLREAHIPQDWLKKIPKDPLPEETLEKEIEHA